MKIPDYYKNYKKPAGTAEPPQPRTVLKGEPPEIGYQANSFNMKLYEDWQDKSIYSISGPVTDGIQHNITILIEQDVEADNLQDFAEWNVQTLESELKSCLILKKGEVTLNDARPAYRVIYRWFPSEDMRLYQEMFMLLLEKTSYKLTATFTKKTRKTLGPQVERMMLSFEPQGLPQPEEKQEP